MIFHHTAKRITVIVVEDNTTDFILMRVALTAAFLCSVKQVITKDEFEQALEEQLPDVIVSDSNIVSFDGFAALRIAKEKCPEVPFAFCCGGFPQTVQADAHRNGVPCILKDAQFSGLIDFIRKSAQ